MFQKRRKNKKQTIPWLPPTDPMKALQFASSSSKFSFISLRIFGSALTSATAAFIATLAALPITELKVKIAPTFTPAGVWQYTQPLRNTQIKTTSGRTTTECFIVTTILISPPHQFFTIKTQTWLKLRFHRLQKLGQNYNLEDTQMSFNGDKTSRTNKNNHGNLTMKG